MRIEANQLWSYFEWLFDQYGLLTGLIVAVTIFTLGFVGSYVFAMWRVGPVEGFYQVTSVIYELIARDIPGTSFRRIYALARLAFQEAIRRRVLVVVAVFVVIMLFAGWFLDRDATNVAKLYIVFTMFSSSVLIVMLGLFLSCFSLPTDIKSKTVQTIVTKPVRPTEILLGRVFGFAAVGTVMLAVMGLLSYVFVSRGIRHTHRMESVSSDGLSGTTTFDAKHQHTFRMLPDDPTLGITSDDKGHTHRVVAREVNGETVYEFEEPGGLLGARIPVFGEMSITDRKGNISEDSKGLNVGYESEYHTYIEGASLMSARWMFTNVTDSRFPSEYLPIELTLEAFRTLKGDIVTGVQGSITLQSEDGRVESKRIPFIVKEFSVDSRKIESEIDGTVDGEPKKLNIYKDIAKDGNLRVIIRCEDRGQYFGMAPPDVYLRAGDSSFAWNMFKGFLGLWMQMMLVICLGVMFSTFLSGPVAMVATLTCLVLGYFGDVAFAIATGEIVGGGPIASIIRLPMQSGTMMDLDMGNSTLEMFVARMDEGIMYTLAALFQAIPSFGEFNTSQFVASGFDIFPDLVARNATLTVAYFCLTMLIGYFFLKTKELAAA